MIDVQADVRLQPRSKVCHVTIIDVSEQRGRGLRQRWCELAQGRKLPFGLRLVEPIEIRGPEKTAHGVAERRQLLRRHEMSGDVEQDDRDAVIVRWRHGLRDTWLPLILSEGGNGSTGRALIVHHRGRGPTQFQALVQQAFAEGLQAEGWQVDITTASRQTPTDLSGYNLLVLGAQAYNWSPARPVVDYVDRVRNLRGKRVVVIVSGGGMTERAMRVLKTRIVKAGRVIVDAIEIWTSRSNEERHGLTDPVAIMRRAGARVTREAQQKTA